MTVPTAAVTLTSLPGIFECRHERLPAVQHDPLHHRLVWVDQQPALACVCRTLSTQESMIHCMSAHGVDTRACMHRDCECTFSFFLVIFDALGASWLRNYYSVPRVNCASRVQASQHHSPYIFIGLSPRRISQQLPTHRANCLRSEEKSLNDAPQGVEHNQKSGPLVQQHRPRQGQHAQQDGQDGSDDRPQGQEHVLQPHTKMRNE